MKTKQLLKLGSILVLLFCFNCREAKETSQEEIIAVYQDSLQDAKNQIDSLKYDALMNSILINKMDSTYVRYVFTDSLYVSDANLILKDTSLDSLVLEDLPFQNNVLKDINLQSFVLDDNATVKYKLNKDPGLQKIEIIIGGVKVDLSKDTVKGVRIYSGGDIWTTVTVKQGIGNYTLELSDVQLNGVGKKWKVTPTPSESVIVDGSNNAKKNLTFYIKK